MCPAPCSTTTMPTKRPVAPQQKPDWSFRNVPDSQLQARGSGWFRRYSPGNITARLNRTNPTTGETLSSVETERIPPPENAELALKLNTVSGLDWTAWLSTI
ncbi:hypothetical protein AKAW_07816 [Aspergillus luchuensis IFO 4308]|nr:hypothetical protein AKAW_07816 [Aspergillus luchuensis IFO 4308]